MPERPATDAVQVHSSRAPEQQLRGPVEPEEAAADAASGQNGEGPQHGLAWVGNTCVAFPT